MDGLSTMPVYNVTRETPLTLARILARVCEEFGVSEAAIRTAHRSRFLAEPRQAFCWLAKRARKWSYPQIGRFIGRDHSTVMYAVEMVPFHMIERAEFARRVHKVMDALEILHHPQPVKQFCPHCGHEVN